MKDEKLYYIIKDGLGISLFDMSNDTMSSVAATRERSKWLKFSENNAREVQKFLNFEIVLAE